MIMNRLYLCLVKSGKTVLGVVMLLLVFGQPAWSAITHVNSTSVVTGSSGSTSLALAYPVGLASDDILIAQVAVGNNPTFTAPVGWTLINKSNNSSSLSQAIYWKRAGTSNPASDTWSFSASDRAAGTMSAYRGVDPIVPVNVFSSLSNASSTSVAAGSITPTVAGSQLIGLYAVANGNASFTPPAGMAEREDIPTGAGPNGIGIEFTDETYAGGTTATGGRVAASSVSAVSIAHLVALQPSSVANFRMDELTWSGLAGQVGDSSGRGYHAMAINGALTSSATPAIANSPGTCGYGVFDGTNDYVAVPASFPDLATDFTVAAWVRTTNNAKSGQRIFIDDQNNTGGFGFSLGDGGTGVLRFYARSTSPVILDTPSVIQNNTWYFVAATMSAVAKTKSIYVYSQAGAQLAFVTQTYTGTWGTDSGAASIGGENNASSESGSGFKFSGNLDEVSVFSGALSASKLSIVMNETRPCSGSPTVVPSGFNAFETATAGGSVSGVIKTQVSASNFDLAIVALKTGGTAIETTFVGDVKLEIVNASAGGSCGAYALIQGLGTLTFATADAGRKNKTGINEPNAWPNARIRMTYPSTGAPTIVGCSTDPFAIRPDYFVATATDATSTTAGATRTLANIGVNNGNVHKAGQPFQVSATSRNSAGATTSNYLGTPVASMTGCILPTSGCVAGALTTGAWSTVAGSGIAKTTDARYSEVGAITMKLVDSSFAAVDAADGSTAAEMNIESAVFNVGRFVPDHFDLIPASVPVFRTFNDTTCPTRSFTYLGQPFGYVTLPQASITAKNMMGGTTLNYTGNLWKLVGTAGFFPVYSATVGTPDGVLGTPTVTDMGSGTGQLVVDSAETFFFTRNPPIMPAIPVMPFLADITLTLSIGDMAENAVTGNGTIDTLTPAVFPSIAFDSGNQIRFGRLALSNAHGSEVLNLPVPAETQFWNGAGFTRNTADFCTQLVAANVGLSNWQRNLNACETSVSLSGRVNAGRGNLRLSAPGLNNTGSVDLTLNLAAAGAGNTCPVATVTGADQPWLRSGPAFNQNPVARASFGLYRGNKPLIYMREMY
ncbi:MAG: DUF6701 domain-containing protein [Thiobacillus sp.]